MGRPACEDCQRAYTITGWDTAEDKARKAGGPPCASCRPVLRMENAEAVRVYEFCGDQWIMGFGGPVALDITGIETAMRLLGVSDRLTCFRRVKLLAAARLEKLAREKPGNNANR